MEIDHRQTNLFEINVSILDKYILWTTRMVSVFVMSTLIQTSSTTSSHVGMIVKSNSGTREILTSP